MINAFLLLLAILGHGFLWIGLVNRLHAVNIRRRTIKRITLVLFFFAAAIPIAIIVWCINHAALPMIAFANGRVGDTVGASVITRSISVYLMLCAAIGAITLVRLIAMRWLQRIPAVVRYSGRRLATLNLQPDAERPEDARHHPMAHWPFNEILRLQITERAIEFSRLPAALDGLTIVQLSDLHFTGYIGKTYFRELVRVANELEPDLICLTGDLFDSTKHFAWIDDTLAKLRARYGVYFILGNHDLRVDSQRLREILTDRGLIDLGGHWRTLDIAGETIVLCGNERPWFKHPGDWQHGPAGIDSGEKQKENAPAAEHGFRIALAHSPDQLGWARSRGIDLMLSGHTHGGQICIPPFGALFSPSARGVRYLAGVHDVPPTVLHISRGISSDIPIRWRCPPELIRLELRASRQTR